MKTLFDRIKSETPKFFKGVRNAAISVGASAVTLLAANDTMGLGLSVDLIQVIKYAIAISVAMAGTSQLTKEQ